MMSDMASGRNIIELQKDAYLQLNKCLIEALEKGDITTDEMRSSARYISFHLNAVESYEELLLLLNSIAEQWPVYQGVYVNFKKEKTANEDALKLQALQEKLRQLTGSIT